jgi:hypothetical protein
VDECKFEKERVLCKLSDHVLSHRQEYGMSLGIKNNVVSYWM